jgi:hypothetical protein
LIVALSVLSLVLAWFSWRYVERPFRDRKRVTRRQIFTVTGSAIAGLAAVAVVSIATQGFIGRFPKADHYLLATNPGELGRYVERRFRQLQSGSFSSDKGRKRVLVIGDSFAQDFINMAFENGFMKDAEVVTFGIANRCPSYVGSEDVARFYEDLGRLYDKQYCENFSNIRQARDLVDTADLVIFAAFWEKWEVERIAETVTYLADGSEGKIVVVGDKHFGRITPRQFVSAPQPKRPEILNDVPEPHAEINAILQKKLPETGFIDVLNMLCVDGRRCPLFTPDSRLISYDGAHLTAEGARCVGDIVFRHPILRQLR